MNGQIDYYGLFKSIFRGRDDVVPKHFTTAGTNGKPGRSGYAPICNNFWKTGICPKASGDKSACCDKCSSRDYVPLSDALLQGHFEGKHILGVYPLLPDGTCWFVAADFDDHTGTGNPLPDVLAYVAAAKIVGFTPYLLRSKSGKGFHVYLFFATAVPAWKPRRVAFSLLQEAGLVGGDVSVNSFDRLFPNQDELSPTKPLGNLIGLPYQGEASKSGHTLLLDPASGYTTAFADQLAVLTSLIRASETDLDAIIAVRGLTKDTPKATATSASGGGVPATTKPIQVPASIPETKRNDTLFRVAASLHAKGLSDQAIREALLAENAAKCVPPLDTQEVEDIVQNVTARYAKGVSAAVAVPGALASLNATMTAASGNAAPTQLPTIHSMLPDAPVSANAVVPGKMNLSIHDGIAAWVDNGKGQSGFKRVFPVAIVLVERLKCVHTGKEQVKLAWHMDDAWHFQMVDRKVIADTRDIVSLASYGLPITSEHKDFLVKYLSAYDFVNRRCIPLIQVSSRFGWQNGNFSFLWGRNLITKEGMLSAAAINTKNGPSAIGAATIVFRGSDDGDEQVADGFDCSGSLTGWLATANRAIVHPIPFVVMLASFAPPLLTLIGASNFVVETAGITSTGKTSTQRLAASVWGCPDERAEASVLHTWDTTRIWVERTGSLLNGLPLILDDTKRVFSSLPTKEARALVNAVVYAYASGKGRGRGSVQGTQRTGSFRSVLISSGEEPCTGASSQHGGARARVLSLWGAPFGSAPQPDLVKDVNIAVMANYGFAGPYLVRHLLMHRAYWAVWKGEFQQLQAFYATLAEGNNVAGRLAEIFAVLEFTAVRLQEALPGLVLPRPTREVLRGIWDATVADAAQDADRALAALRDVAEWAIANQQKFYGRHKSDGNSKPIEPLGGFVGRFDAGDSWIFIAFLRKPLCDLLEKFGHDVSATLRVWSERGWLLSDSKGRNQRQVRINGTKPAAYCVNRAALENEVGMDFRPDQVASNSPNPFAA
jgi:hypothetical protein